MLKVYRRLPDCRRELDVFRPRNAHVKIISRRAELIERELLAVGAARVDTVLRNVDVEVADVKSYDRVVDTVVGADSRLS